MSAPEANQEREQLGKLWAQAVKRVRQRRGLFGLLIAQSRPVEIRGNALVVDFACKEARICRQILEMPEYQRLLEEELERAFRIPLRILAANGCSPEAAEEARSGAPRAA